MCLCLEETGKAFFCRESVLYSSSQKMNKGVQMQKYICTVCGYIYDPVEGDPDGGIAPGTAFDDIPDDWRCPTCGVDKSDFEPYEG